MAEMSDNPELAELRTQIDKVDLGILRLLKVRADIVEKVADVKVRAGLEPHQPGRFAELLGRLQLEAANLGLDPLLVEGVWNAIHEDSLARQAASTIQT